MATRTIANLAAAADSRDETGAQQPARSAADTAVTIGLEAIELARRARAIGLSSVAHALESAALQAGSEAATAQWPTDA
jgi:hypothetical protein